MFGGIFICRYAAYNYVMLRPHANRLTLYVAIGVAGAVAIVIALFASGAFNQSKTPDVKFIDFTPEGTITLKQGQSLPVSFNIVNNEQFAASGISVSTTHDGEPQFFTIDRPLAAIEGTLGANGGRTGTQTINIIGNANSQDAVETDFTVRLLVIDGQLADTKTFKVRLEK